MTPFLFIRVFPTLLFTPSSILMSLPLFPIIFYSLVLSTDTSEVVFSLFFLSSSSSSLSSKRVFHRTVIIRYSAEDNHRSRALHNKQYSDMNGCQLCTE